MKRITTLILVLIISALVVVIAFAADGHNREASFTVDNMTCAACPITVRKAMQRVDGVEEVKVDFDSKIATVIYDAALTDAQEIEDASSIVGFPATVIDVHAE